MAAGVDIALDVMEEITRAAPLPQMMVRIDDWHLWGDRLLAAFGEPTFVDCEQHLLFVFGLANFDAQHIHDFSAPAVKRIVLVALLHALARDNKSSTGMPLDLAFCGPRHATIVDHQRLPRTIG
jgi:hypothetical protein